MVRASVANQHDPVLNCVASAAVGGALVDPVDEVDAFANRVTFDYSHTHGGGLEGLLGEGIRGILISPAEISRVD